VVPKQEIAPTMPPVPPPAPQPKVAEAKPAEAKPEPKPKEAEKKETAPKPDPIAEVLKKEEAKKPEPKKEEAKAPTPPKPAEPQKPQPKFDATRISALLDKRAPQRQAAADAALNYTATAGTKNGTSAQLSASEIDAFKRKLQGCWNPPAGVSNAEKMIVPITVRLKLDGTLATPPQPDIDARDPAMRAMVDSTVRALIMCQPYTMFSAAKYDTWKELPLDFSPRDLFGG
jgi:colicin import membrane protein